AGTTRVLNFWAILATAPILSGQLCRQFEDLLELRRTGDGPRVARDPRRLHRPLGEAREALRTDPHRPETARHAEAADKRVEDIAGVLAGMAHRGGDQRLAFGVDWLVPAHH